MELGGTRVLVTGGAGFLGRRVCALLQNAGPGVLIVPRREAYDLTEQVSVRRLFTETRPEIVVHLAAEVGGIGANESNPGRYFYANAAMGIHLIEESRRMGVRKFLQVGTVCSYPKYSRVPFSEEDLWNGFPEETNAPYGIAKKALLVMLTAYREQYGLNGAYLIPVNLYGPGDNFDARTSHVIPALIQRFVEARECGRTTVEVWGTGAASREFLYIDDAARAVVTALECYDDPDPLNVGAGEEVTIADLARLIARLTRFQGDIRWDMSKPDGQPRRRVDTSRAVQRLGFRAEIPLEVGLRRTIQWWEKEGRHQ